VNPRELLDGIYDANFHLGGIRCLRLLRLGGSYLGALRAEIVDLCEHELPSDVRSTDHITNWTRPRGEVLQFSLFNRSGQTDDFSDDHELFLFDKHFHRSARYPALHELINALPDLVNFRVNVLGPAARLAAHEEHALIRTPCGSIGVCVRLHLPIVTTTDAELILDGQAFHLPAGIVHYVNHGCVHAARNPGADARVHLVWDQLLTRAVFDAIFGHEPGLSWATALPDPGRLPRAVRTERMGAYLSLPPPVGREEARHLELVAPLVKEVEGSAVSGGHGKTQLS
jgi:hypothetical protein